MARKGLVADTFVGLVDSLVDDFDIIEMLVGLADGCIDLDLATAAGILLADETGKLRVVAASSDKAHLLELFQLQNDEGPCLEAFSTGASVAHLDLVAASDRWPRFAPEAVNAGFHSVYAFPLRMRAAVFGAMNLFDEEGRVISEAEVHLAQALADVASIAILQDQVIRQADLRAGQLQHALDSRVAIEQAKGMVAERAHTDMETAFRVLREYARSNRRHLTDVAVEMVEGVSALDDLELATEIGADLGRTGGHGEFQAGEPTGPVAVSSDLTDLRQAEESARHAQRLGHAVLESVRFPVAVLSSEGTILDVNPAWEDFSSQNNGDAETNGIGVDYLASVRTAAESDPELVEVIDGIESVLNGHRQFFTTVYPRHSPTEERWFRMQVTPISGVGAAIVHVNMTTEVLARQTLERTVAAKDRFLATVSHELRTPLTAVLGFSEHLMSSESSPDESDEYHGLIAGQAREVADLVEDLLLAGRLDTGTIMMRPEKIPIARLIDEVVRPWQDSEEIVVTTSDDHEIFADPLRTRQIVRNLVTNAIRHGSAPFEIHTERKDSTVVIHVIDSGPGVPLEEIPRMYEPYSEGSEPHGQSGSMGLGLFVSHRLAKMMKGTVTYRRSDQTTIFTLTLPAPHAD